MCIAPRITHLLLSKSFERNLTLVMLGALQHLRCNQGQVARRKSRMEPKKKQGKNFRFQFWKRRFKGLSNQDDREREDTLPFESLVDVQVKQLDVFPSGEVGFEGL